MQGGSVGCFTSKILVLKTCCMMWNEWVKVLSCLLIFMILDITDLQIHENRHGNQQATLEDIHYAVKENITWVTVLILDAVWKGIFLWLLLSSRISTIDPCLIMHYDHWLEVYTGFWVFQKPETEILLSVPVSAVVEWILWKHSLFPGFY